MPEIDPRVPTPDGLELERIAPAERGRLTAAVELVCDPARREPAWRISPLPGGASNLNYLVERPCGPFVLRVPPDRDRERFGFTQASGLAVQSAAAAAGVAPAVVAYRTPDGVCLVPYLAGVVLGSESVRAGDRLERVGRLLRRLHEAPPIEPAWSPFADIERYAAIAVEEGLELPPDCGQLLEANRRVEEALEGVPGATALCHNDLQPQNLIEVDGRLWLIDWEYAGMSNRYFDLGNFATNTDLTGPELERLLTGYFGDGADLAVESARAMLMRLVSGMREAYWSVIAEPVLANDWDYKQWAADFFARCRAVTRGGDFERWLSLASARAAA